MKILKKIIISILLAIFAYYAVTTFTDFNNMELYCYKNVKTFQKPSKIVSIFNDSIANNSTIKSIYKDYFDDTICVLNYKNKFQFLIWNIKKFENISLLNIKDTSSIKFKTYKKQHDKNSAYETIREPLFNLKVRLKLNSPENKITICFNDTCNYKTRKSKNYIDFYTKCNNIDCIINPKYYDFRIKRNSDSNFDFIVCKWNDNFYIIMSYSTDGTNINSNNFYKILNPKLYER